MSKADILEKLKEVVLDLYDEEVNSLLEEGLKAGLTPMELITDGLNPSVNLIGELYEKKERFMSDLVMAGEIMNGAMEILRPVMEAGGKSLGDTMVIGTVEGDQHNIGKRIVAAMFTGAGYKVVDIGENMPASEFVKAIKELKANVVGASAILGPVKAYCKVINDAMIEAGMRDDVIFIVGGWGMTQHFCDEVGADAYGENAVDAVSKVKMIRAGELQKYKERLGK